MFFYRKIRDNIFNPAYYRQVLMAPTSSAFSYYFKMTLWLVLCYTAFVSLVFLPEMVQIARQLTTELSGVYPTELKIRLGGGTASVNLPEPVVIPLTLLASKLFNYNTAQTGKVVGNLAVIDTRAPFQLADFANYHSVFVLKKDAVAAGAGNEIKVTALPTGNNVIIDKSAIDLIAGKTQTLISILAPLSVLLVYLAGLVFFVFTLLSVLVTALAAWALLLVATGAGAERPRFTQALAVTLHAVTLSLIANFFTFLVYPSISVNFPFLLTFSLLVIYANLIRKQKPVFIPPVAPKEIPTDTITTPTAVESKPEDTTTNTQNPA